MEYKWYNERQTTIMQNKKCKMLNYGMDCVHVFLFIFEENTSILHFAFCILHLSVSS